MHETSGILGHAVQQYLTNPLACSLSELSTLRAYFRLWINARVWDMNPSLDDESRAELARLRLQCDGITNLRDMMAWLRAAEELGMDPL